MTAFGRYLVTLLLGATPVAAFAQAPGIVTPVTTTTGVVGRVVDGRTRLPLPGAKVMLGAPRDALQGDGIGVIAGLVLDDPRSILTDAAGRFAFPDLAEGGYGIIATLDGWRPGFFGANEPGAAGRAISLVRGKPADVTITLWPLATVEGTVRDERGEPLAGATIQLLEWTTVDGRRDLHSAGFAITDDRGQFSETLLDGEYYLRVDADGQTRVRLDPATRRRVTYGFVPTFYPNAASVAEAEPLVLAPGISRVGMEIRLPLRPVVMLSGVLRRPAGPGRMPTSVEFRLQDDSNIRRTASVDSSGRFVLPNLPPGQYLLSADPSFPLLTSLPEEERQTRTVGPALWAKAIVTVGSQDSELAVDLRPRIIVRGRVEFDGATPPTGEQLRSLSVTMEGPSGRDYVAVEPDGRFSLELQPGRYIASAGVTVTTGGSLDSAALMLSINWQLRHAWLRGQDVSLSPLVLSGDVDGLQLVFGMRMTTEIAGVVVDTPDTFNSVAVVLFPDDASDRRVSYTYTHGLSELRTDIPFRQSVLPGKYLAVVVGDGVPYRDPGVLDAIAAFATPVSVGEGETVNVRLRAVDASAALATRPAARMPSGDIETLVASPLRTAPVMMGAVISGRVVAIGTGEPIANVRVSPSGFITDSNAVYSDEDGRFALTGLPAGQHELHASKPSWGTTMFGSSGGNSPGTRVSVAANGTADGFTIEMHRSAALEVVILDPGGNPIPGYVVLMRQRWQAGGRVFETVMFSGGTTLPFRNGRYRFAGLPPGEFIVGIEPYTPFDVEDEIATTSPRDIDRVLGRAAPPAAPASVERSWRYATLFYPGVVDPDAMQPVRLVAGEDRVIVIHAQPLPVAKVSGVIRSTAAEGYYSLRVESHPATVAVTGDHPRRDIGVESSGEFVIQNLSPGRYRMFVTRRADNEPADAPVALTTELVVGDHDQEGLALDLLPGGTVSGRLLLDGAAPETVALASLTITATMQDDSNGRIFNTGGRVEADGRFTIAHVPAGKYYLKIDRGKTALVVQSQRIQERETIDTGITVTSNGRVDDIEVRALTSASTLWGVVRDAGERPVPSSYVVLFPAESSGWATSRRIFGARTDASGRYRLGDVPPGRYKAAVSADLSPDDWFDPQVLKRLEPGAVDIEIDRVNVERDLRGVP